MMYAIRRSSATFGYSYVALHPRIGDLYFYGEGGLEKAFLFTSIPQAIAAIGAIVSVEADQRGSEFGFKGVFVTPVEIVAVEETPKERVVYPLVPSEEAEDPDEVATLLSILVPSEEAEDQDEVATLLSILDALVADEEN